MNRAQRRQRERERLKAPTFLRLQGEIIERTCVLDLDVCHPDEPSAPRRGSTDKFRRVRAVIDTGATQSAINPRLVSDLGLPQVDEADIHTPTGVIEKARVVRVRLWLESDGSRVHTPRRVVVCDQMEDDFIFGMDALWDGILTVDLSGEPPAWEWKLAKTRPLRVPWNVE